MSQAAPYPQAAPHARATRHPRSGPRAGAGGGTRDARRVPRPQAGGAAYLPKDWPAEVWPPGVEDWELSAISYLLDCCPADFRDYPVLRRHPVVLAQFATQVLEGQVEAGQRGLAGARLQLRDHVAPHVVEQAVQAWHREIERLRQRQRGVALVDDALRGCAFVPRL